MEKKSVLVTGIGGNVGQGIIRNIIESKYPITIVGCNIANFSAGNYLCDAFELVPYAFDENYIPTITEIIKKHKIDLIIPSTDYEVYYLAKNKHLLTCDVACSSETASSIYLDKWLTWLHHQKNNIPFANSCMPSQFNNQYNEHITKPKKGRGSRGLHINHINPKSFADEEYMVQDLAKGKEITTAFYVTKQKQLHGLITMERTLENGTTNFSKVVFNYNAEIIKTIIEPMIKLADIKGSINVQSIVTENNQIIPFEVNCRISGTNSIRTNFGFKDVKYTLQEYLYNQQPEEPNVTAGIAVRVLLDVIYPNATTTNDLLTNKTNSYIF